MRAGRPDELSYLIALKCVTTDVPSNASGTQRHQKYSLLERHVAALLTSELLCRACKGTRPQGRLQPLGKIITKPYATTGMLKAEST